MVPLVVSLTLGAHAQEGYCSWSVCLLSHISPLERLFVLKTLSRTQRATKIKKFVGFSLIQLRCRDPALPLLKGICTVGHFPAESAHAHSDNYHVVPLVVSFLLVCCAEKAISFRELIGHASKQGLSTM